MARRSEPEQLLAAIRKQMPGMSAGLKLDERTLRKLKEQALKKAADLQQTAALSAKEGLAGARLIGADLASGNAKRAGTRLSGFLSSASGSAGMLYLARLLVCCYFLNAIYEKVESYQFLQQPEVLERARRWPQYYPAPRFPWFSCTVLLPCAVLAALGVRVLWTASVLVAYEALDSLQLVWGSLLMLLANGAQPNELVMKRLAMMGCVGLVLAHSMKEQRVKISSYAGLLLSGDSRGGARQQPGRGKSAVLLLGRLLMACLFLFVGITQLQRVFARDFILARHLPHSKAWEQDGHDNNWLLLEFVLAIPFAAGWKVGGVSRLLAATLVAEAVTCWPFWREWPTPSYSVHVRLHFATNLGVAGGLLLLASFGAGRFTEQGHLLEKLTDLEETELRARLLAAHRLHDPHKPRFATQDTMADTILAQSLEAAKEDFEARMNAKGKGVLCEHGHEHDFCCGGDKSEVQAGE
ncbi:family transcriptional regulator [Micractinium conductrix]|uniref:Family transcriptional regulator n=1 Tax=Micractinium conductrix TaxID=554055 RepID=A0A2P6V1V2_9CHLO|nr:family transcriptional regulator [Micractinium conductrix]|eukprot:PSC68068.1 family transcriptional regulator [Micractinium conductrix]